MPWFLCSVWWVMKILPFLFNSFPFSLCCTAGPQMELALFTVCAVTGRTYQQPVGETEEGV